MKMSERLKLLRIRLGNVTQMELAARMGLSRATIHNAESGRAFSDKFAKMVGAIEATLKPPNEPDKATIKRLEAKLEAARGALRAALTYLDD